MIPIYTRPRHAAQAPALRVHRDAARRDNMQGHLAVVIASGVALLIASAVLVALT